MDLELSGKTALVTGSYRGTGARIAEALAAEGAYVLVHELSAGQADETLGLIGEAGNEGSAVTGDLGTNVGRKSVIEDAVASGRQIEILVNNYGTSSRGNWARDNSARDNSAPDNSARDDSARDDSESAGEEAWIDIYQKNVLSAVELTQAFLPAMRERNVGRIIQIGTIGSTRPGNQMPHYYASKAALHNATLSLARELLGTGITVNLVSPGLIRTKEVEQSFRARAEARGWPNGPDDWDEIARRVLGERGGESAGRIARREDIADLVLFLASPRAAFISAANIKVDGGGSANYA